MVKMTSALEVYKEDNKDAKELWSTTRANLDRHLYSCLLAVPNFRWRVKTPKKDIPNIETSELLWPVSKAALKARCTQHIQDLFDLAYRPKCFAREDFEPKRHSGQGPYEGGHWASPAALTTPMKIRLTHLAVPRRCQAKCTKKFYGSKLTERQRKLLDIYIDNATKTVYYRKPTKTMSKPKPRIKGDYGFKWPKGKGKKKAPSMDHLTKLATPKAVPLPQEISRGKKVDLDSISDNLAKLATPPPRQTARKVNMDKYFQVKPGALSYNPSDRIAQIAQPKIAYSEGSRNPYVVSPGALHYEASPRVKELATPNERKPPPTDDIREEPFVVNPVALKAMCSPRTAELATPRARK